MTQYLPYHPGGTPKLMEGAGKDCTSLFNKYHRWVNCESILGKCLLGAVSSDEPSIAEADEEDDQADEENGEHVSSKINHNDAFDNEGLLSTIKGQVTVVEEPCVITSSNDSNTIVASSIASLTNLNLDDISPINS